MIYLKKVLFALTAVVALTSVTPTIKSHESVFASQVALNIDPRITGHEREVMERVMQGLSPQEQENVTYIDENGIVYANKPELKNTVMNLTKVETKRNNYSTSGVDEDSVASTDSLFENETGETFVFPNQEQNPFATTSPEARLNNGFTNEQFQSNQYLTLSATYPTATGGTGPYRRVFSNKNYSWAQASVYLPGGTNIKSYNDGTKPNTNDTGYIYMGGWGANGGAVDAGFMHSATNDNWALMTQVDGAPHGYTDRLLANQTATFKFWVSAPNEITLYVYGKDYTTQALKNYTHIQAAPGFSTSASNVIKRMTTIGQSPYQGLKSTAFIKGVEWSNVLIGTSQTSNHAWSSSDQATDATDGSNGYHTYTSDVVSVNFVNAGHETDSIDLR